ncbi:LysR family transcriptional regulator [Actinomycetes bacterium KLBMP 9759]
MEFRQLQYFVAVAEAGSFTRAAERLHIGQPAVSQLVGRLERQVGLALFERSTRHVRLTPAGERLLPEARAALRAVDRVRQVAAELGPLDTPLRIGSSHGLGGRLYRALDELAATAPDVAVTLSRTPREQRLADVREGRLDAAFVRVTTSAAGLRVVPLWEEQLVVALPQRHPLAARADLDWADLGELPLRLAPAVNNPLFHAVVSAALRAAGVDPPPGPPFTTLQDTLAEIGTGPPSWTVFNHSAELPHVPRVALRPLPEPTVPISLAVRPGPLPSGLSALLDACRRVSVAEWPTSTSTSTRSAPSPG